MSEQEKVTEEVITNEETPEEGVIELSASIDSSGRFVFNATDGVHPMFLVGLLEYAKNSIINKGKSVESNE